MNQRLQYDMSVIFVDYGRKEKQKLPNSKVYQYIKERRLSRQCVIWCGQFSGQTRSKTPYFVKTAVVLTPILDIIIARKMG